MLHKLILLIFMILPMALRANEAPLVERFAIRHLPAARIAERLEIFTASAGAPVGHEPNLRAIPVDGNTLQVTFHRGAGGELERQRLMLMTRDVIAGMDRPHAMMTIDVYAVQSSLLTDVEFFELDTRLREGPMPLTPSLTAKGVVYWSSHEAVDQEVVPVQEIRGQASGQYLSGPVTAAGRMLPSVLPDGTMRLFVEFTLETREGILIEGQSKVVAGGYGNGLNNRPLVIAAGQSRPLTLKPGQAAPPRHEMMIYFWMRPSENKP